MYRWVFGLMVTLCTAASAAPATRAPLRDWKPVGGGWRAEGRQPQVLWQRKAKGPAAAMLQVKGAGGCWRCLVEPAPGAGEAGLWFAASPDRKQGFLLTLGGGPAGGGLFLRDAAGKALWDDAHAPWVPYQPYWLEGVVEAGRTRVQMLLWDRRTLVSQSPWIPFMGASGGAVGRPGPNDRAGAVSTGWGKVSRPAPGGAVGKPAPNKRAGAVGKPAPNKRAGAPRRPAPNGSSVARAGMGLALHTRDRIARFYRWEQAKMPLSPVVENAPNKLRLRHGPDTDWAVVGPGNWMWSTPERKVLRQMAKIERSSAIARKLGGSEGTWQCRVKVQPGAGGAGLLFRCDEKAERGFNAWLGGNHGAGGLMLYRMPMEALWSSPQDTWHYDTEYLIEATVKGGKVTVRLMDAAGKEIAASPAYDLKPGEVGKSGGLGFMTWLGTAEFWGFSEETTAAPVAAQGASALGADWQVASGEWRLGDGGVLEQNGQGAATALHVKTRAALGIWRCHVAPGEGTEAAGFLFQADPGLKAGFVCVLGLEARLESLDGRILWRKAGFPWQAGEEYVVEGHVETDRVRVRILAADGAAVLAESVAVYVSDRNNTRQGVLGFRTEGGPARFREWSVK